MSSLLNSSINGSTSNLSDGSGRTFTSSFSGQSGAASPVFHHAGSIQGLHNIHGNFNVPNLSGSLGSRNPGLNGVPSAGVQQQNGSISNGRFASSNIPVALSQISHGSSHGHSGLTNRGGISSAGNPKSVVTLIAFSRFFLRLPPIGKFFTIPGLGVSPILGNAGSRMTSSMGNMVGGGTMGRNLSSGGGLSIPSLGSRMNMGVNSGSGNIGQNRLMGGVLPQGSPQVLSMLGNSYPTAGGLSQNHVQAMNSLTSMGLLNEMNSNDTSPFDINNDFPQLTSRPSSASGQGQLGSRLKQGLGISPIVQQNQEFSIQNEDFPALPGYKGNNADYPMDMHHKEQLHENSILMMQSQQLSMGRSGGFNLAGAYASHRPQQQHAQAVGSSGVSLHGSDIFSSSHPSYHSQAGGPPGIGLRSMNSSNSVTGMGYDQQLIQQYQHQQNTSQYRLQQMSAASQPFREVGLKSTQVTQANPDRFGLLGLLSVIKMTDPDLTSLALGIDLTTLGLNLNSTENLHKTFGSPWSNEPSKGDPEFSVPQCYYSKNPPPLHPGLFAKLLVETLFYIFYSMPKDEAQLYAANELYNRGWFYHKEHRLWFIRIGESLVKTNAYERGSYHCFDPNSFDIVQKENFVVYYEMLEKRPSLSQDSQH
ncbi:probable NOT transcription complex subunit VIP2 isoform X1 [Capsella rubella]|uniref:probable NOT transcription complex subunit VIP2 isoform X1 n=1 Tax=Capsella rubella TaxID=81985 RepID=UPI000CD57B02|nr:probable NOT transcription complex subunit VIP2 isoform X1 [Capsella rubella]XP_023645536.1 probable NOT transcription complex subunit VIP2 isoform X1 [Capsella rubella]